MMLFNTLTEMLLSRKGENRAGITFILSDSDEQFVSYGELCDTALQLLGELQQAGFQKGDEVVFQIDDNRLFIYSFWACILGGMIPVPVTTGTNDEHKRKLFKIWRILNNPRLLAGRSFFEKLTSFAEENDLSCEAETLRARVFYIEETAMSGRVQGQIHHANAGDLAFIQFSSGSTGTPKGVMITHQNVLVNVFASTRWTEFGPNDSSLSWMPLTHDMGLIGTHITDVVKCIDQYNMQTQTFVRHPSLWLQKASEHKVTLLYSPNFGYKHFLKFYRPEADKGWDLSSVRLIFNGAEPISIELSNEFLREMSRYGLKRNAMYFVYGLAEGTIGAAFPRPGEEPRAYTLLRQRLNPGDTVEDTSAEDEHGVTFADLGYPVYECAIRVCDENGRDLGENRIGHVHIKGGNVTSGYYNDPEATQKAITPDGWLNTGDLGLMRNGRIILTGRAKDIIFMAGQNYYSHDIERVAECVDGVELGKICAVGAFSEKLKQDELVLFVIFKQKLENFPKLALELKQVISQKIGIDVSETIPVKSIPKTTSGKVQRYMLRQAYINGEYDFIKEEIRVLIRKELESRSLILPKNAAEKGLADIFCAVLGLSAVSTEDDFFGLGGDSLKVTQLLSRIRDDFQVELQPSDVFENPQVVGLAAMLENARSYEKETIYPKALPQDGRIPLSFAQQRLWFLNELNGDSRQYNLSAAFQIQGALDTVLLEKSMDEILMRHRVLQSFFTEEEGRPAGYVHPSVHFSLSRLDLSGLPEQERQEKAWAAAKEEALGAFDLAKAPLLRGSALQLGEENHILVFAVHHIVFDGWSFGLLLRELAENYRALASGTQPEARVPEIQYYDFAGWQQQNANRPALTSQLDYWTDKLSGKLPALELPADRPRPAVQRYFGARVREALPKDLVCRLQEAAHQEKCTLFMVLLAAFYTLLYRYTGQEDILVGSPVANRTRKETEELIGFFTNNLVLRTSLSGEDSFRALLANVKKTALGAYAHQDISFEKLVEELKVPRDMSRNPLFQVLFSLQNLPALSPDFAGMPWTELDIGGGFSRFDLSLDLCEKNGVLEAVFEYNTDLFHEDTIRRMAGHYRQLLESAASDLGQRLQSMEMLTAQERSLLLRRWNETSAAFEKLPSWTVLFERQAEEMPEAPAVISGNESLTYRALNQRANRLAHFLSEKGVHAETVVGIYLNRSADMLTALAAVHKAGGAYLPLDPIFPKDRLAYMLEDAKVGLLLTESGLKDTLPPCQAELLCLDELSAGLSAFSSENLPGRPHEKNLAYLIYTSGSTGKPKGVQIEQFALYNFLCSMVRDVGFGPSDRLLAVTTLSFDIAGLEMFTPLISGGCVVIAGREDVLDGGRLAALLEEHRVTVMQATPATWRLLIDCGWEGDRDLKILCGGEALPIELAKELRRRCGVLWNMYGPTETTIWSTMDCVESEVRLITVGRPIANTQIYILDSMKCPVPVGIPGELYIGGDGLARGYLNHPQLTGEKFVENPFDAGSRLYRTGDLVRYLSDGRIEFIGRIDHQVKIRGFRIELGEIEALLAVYPAVRQCVVAAKETSPGEYALIAYLVPHAEQDSSELMPEKLRRYLKEKLPDYMVPSAFMLLGEFPKTPNGKIARKALPMPENLRPQLETDYSAPGSSTEEQLTAIWQDVLKLDRIGINDNFFDLGGHSLLLVQLSSRIEKILDKKVPVMTFFKYPTIHTLALFLDHGDKKDEQPDAHEPKAKDIRHSSDIAVIGMSGRFPGADNVDEFWENLCGGKECISRFTEEEAVAEGMSPEVVRKPEYVRAWGALKEVDKFDAAFFGYNPREAEFLDPQQRIFLEETWKALENAGYDSQKYAGSVGIYASTGMNTYMRNLTDRRESEGLANDYQIMISNDKDFLATRVAYKLDLQGPGITVQTACSSSLVAIHMACRSLHDGECDIALAGGVSIRMPQRTGYLYQEGMILSPDGHCRAFDEQARGTVGGNGAGVVVLKRLEDALADGDHIEAVIKGTAINNDGALKAGYTAPRIDGQARAIAEAQRKAGFSPETIGYIEAHGTGTPLGDPIEFEALNQVFSAKTQNKGFCAIGSVKTNIGHLDAAAGVTGFIKTVLALKHKRIPPSLNYSHPNPKIDFENSPFFVNAQLREWTSASTPLRAGISSFGIGGTNAHAVLEEAPPTEARSVEAKPSLLIFSAKSRTALDALTDQFLAHAEKHTDFSIRDAAYTLQMGRREFDFRRFLICTSREEAIDLLKNRDKYAFGTEQRIFDASLSEAKNGASSDHRDITGLSLEQIGQLWLSGAKIGWNSLYLNVKPHRMALPSYPFEGKSYWAAREKQRTGEEKAPDTWMQEGKNPDVSQWFYAPVWKQSLEEAAPEPTAASPKALLVLRPATELSMELTAALQKLHADPVVATADTSFQKLDAAHYRFNPADPEDYIRLTSGLEVPEEGLSVINLLGTDSGADIQTGKQLFYSMLYLTQALGQGRNYPVEIKVLSTGVQKIMDGDPLEPSKALVLGPCRVIPREYPHMRCTLIDFVPPAGEEKEELLDRLSAEALYSSEETTIAYRRAQRWVQTYENARLAEKAVPALPLKDHGTYLITGGLGGIGLALAEYLASQVRANLVLVGRTAFPEESQWDAWMDSHEQEDSVSHKMERLKRIRSLGGTLLLSQTDITDAEQVLQLKNSVRERFGQVNGIIHAAGTPGGGMIQMKKKEFAEKVLASKLEGTITLHTAFKEESPDFILLCSSLNAVTGGFGQADYSAANAFLDEFARQQDSRAGTRVISVDWDRWPGTGMAGGSRRTAVSFQQSAHPLLGRVLLNSEEKSVYRQEIAPEKDWILSEHVVMGTPTIAGTTYLEMARAAFEEKFSPFPAEISEVLFLHPLAVKDGEKRDVFVVLKQEGARFGFQIISRQDGVRDGWREHARGKVTALQALEERTLDLRSISERCPECIFDLSDGEAQLSQEFIRFGGRWQSLQKLYVSKEEGFAEIAIDSAYLSDLAQYKLHPALLDVATGSLRLVNKGNYLPLSYEKICVRAPLTERIFGHIRFRSGFDASAEILSCDMDISDESGHVLAEISNFSMKRVSEAAAQNIRERTANAQQAPEFAELAELHAGADSKANPVLDEGITEPEGREVFRRILNNPRFSQIIVSTKDIQAAIRQASYLNQPSVSSALKEPSAARAAYPRPELSTEYVPPKNDTEKKLTVLWQDVLGIEKVGIHDEFFELGGDSLLLIQFHTRLKETFETEIAVVDLYKYNTVALQAKYLNRDAQAEEAPAFTEVNTRANRQLEAMKQRRQHMLSRKGAE